MNYSKSKAEKLVKEFDYLKSEKYYPYGVKGKAFDIIELKAICETVNRHTAEYFAFSRSNPNYGDETDAKLKLGHNWYVKITITDQETTIVHNLEDVLKKLKIQHDIDKIPN